MSQTLSIPRPDLDADDLDYGLSPESKDMDALAKLLERNGFEVILDTRSRRGLAVARGGSRGFLEQVGPKSFKLWEGLDAAPDEPTGDNFPAIEDVAGGFSRYSLTFGRPQATATYRGVMVDHDR